MKKEKMSLFSYRKIWTQCWNFGIGIGWDEVDKTFCFLIQFASYLIVIGPHLKGK